MFDRFSDDAKAAFNKARQQAQRLHHEYLGTEHILLGLLELSECTAVLALKRMDVDPMRLRGETEELVKTGKHLVQNAQLPFTPRAKRVLELSMEQAGRLGHTCIGTGHLLLGLIDEKEGVGGQVLRGQGVTLEQARKQVLELRGGSYGDSSRLVRTQMPVGLEWVLDRLRTASASLQQMGESAAARKIDQIITDLQSRS